MSALLEFECRVPVGGYEVITIEDQSDIEAITRLRHLLPTLQWRGVAGTRKLRILHSRSERIKRFDLFEINPSAFLEFAQTPATEDGIKAFADRYGLLFPDLRNVPPDVSKFESSMNLFRDIDRWSSFIRQMHQRVEFWNMSDFSKLIRALLRRPRSSGSPVELFLKEDPLSAASAKLCIRPPTLWDALTAQLILAIDGNQNLRSCVQCRKWFTHEAGRGRSDKEYCSNACRMRAYRKRKDSASRC